MSSVNESSFSVNLENINKCITELLCKKSFDFDLSFDTQKHLKVKDILIFRILSMLIFL